MRREIHGNGKLEIVLLREPVTIEIWDGQEWRAGLPAAKISALRLTFIHPPGQVVVR